ncbi:hypothetical protein D1872_249890 [compost metagenome]
MMFACGSGPLIALIIDGSYRLPGNSLTMSTPSSSASWISLIVIAPGITGIRYRLQSITVSRFRLGPTTNSAPLRMAARAVSGSSTVPTPIIAYADGSAAFQAYLRAKVSIARSANGTVIVTSITLIPPAIACSAISTTCSGVSPRRTATTPSSAIFWISCSFFTSVPLFPLHLV